MKQKEQTIKDIYADGLLVYIQIFPRFKRYSLSHY